MIEKFDRGWRVFATGFCFASFGVGGLLIQLLVYPGLRLFVWRRSRRAAIAKSVIQRSFRLFLRMMTILGVVTYEVQGRNRLARQGLLVIANHPTLVDVIMLIALIDRADCIVKGALVSNPFTRGPILAADYICNNSGTGTLEDCIASIRSGNNLIIFPEGTRTPLTGQARMQRGAANIAVRGGIDLTPVRIRCSQPWLTKGAQWYSVPKKRVHMSIIVEEDIRVGSFVSDGRGEAVAARKLTSFLATYFGPEIERAYP